MVYRRNLNVLGICLISGLIFLIWQIFNVTNIPLFGRQDFSQYWATTRIFFSGGNPYDAGEVWKLQKEILPALDQAVLMWNPPIVFLFTIPFSIFNFETAARMWFVCSVLTLGAALIIIIEDLRAYSKNAFVWCSLFILTFYPAAVSLSYGQISAILLIGATGIITWSAKTESPLRATFCGVALAVTTIKPHLFYLIYIWFFLAIVNGLNRAVLKAAIGMLILMLLPMLFVNYKVLEWYFQAARHPPIEFMTPTLGSWLQDVTAVHSVWIRLLPTVITATIALFCLRGKRPASELNLLLPLSFVTSPYGWVFDQTALLPVALWLIATSTSTLVRAILILANVALAITPPAAGQQYAVWYPLLLSLLICKNLYTNRQFLQRNRVVGASH